MFARAPCELQWLGSLIEFSVVAMEGARPVTLLLMPFGERDRVGLLEITIQIYVVNSM